MISRVLLILTAVFTVAVAGLFAGAETGMYKLSRLRLRLGIEKRKFAFVTLGKCLHDSAGVLVSLLIGTNLAHYLATSIVTYLFLSRVEDEHAAELFTMFIAVPILFVFSEVIPKNLFFYRADFLMPFFAPVLFSFHKIFSWCGAVPLLKFMSGIFGRLTGSAASKAVMTATQRHHVKAIFADTQEEAIFSSVQNDIINRLISISGVRIRSVMVPINKVEMVDVNSDKSVLMDKLKKSAFTRLPVMEGRVENVVGFINIYEVLTSSEQFTDLRKFIKPIRSFRADTVVIDAINIMQSENHKIILVTPRLRSGQAGAGHTGGDRPVGIVTMKDLVEELLGELTEW
jgi:putative hemolysin